MKAALSKATGNLLFLMVGITLLTILRDAGAGSGSTPRTMDMLTTFLLQMEVAAPNAGFRIEDYLVLVCEDSFAST